MGTLKGSGNNPLLESVTINEIPIFNTDVVSWLPKFTRTFRWSVELLTRYWYVHFRYSRTLLTRYSYVTYVMHAHFSHVTHILAHVIHTGMNASLAVTLVDIHLHTFLIRYMYAVCCFTNAVDKLFIRLQMNVVDS